ncbi:hypothetical protein NEOLEDRAFT_1056468 [Neolentinus lepideus HHB14362 ss-1]|uniref:Uncharacterized protein n=1 Tax=Neolentinus lepideus HHB14362 ss-1 TaxID=1314782 RepID=A0A165VD07_9AGAM|nr:hypothetical protein NEOLEDRAFT_1056468 [Neolentinus lepideus HHB14362 ss-1]
MRFPPFPAAPEGVSIVPFKDFKATGIQMRIAGEDQVEIDGLGIPTVQLRVKHFPDGSDGKQQKKRKRKKKNAFAGGAGQLQRPWWEVWEEGEELCSGNYDLDTSSVERLHVASHDFIQGRPWPMVNEGLRNLWDQFRLYVGLMSHPVQPPSKKRAKQIIEGAIDNPDDDDDDAGCSDDDMPNPTPAPIGPLDPLVQVEVDRIFKERQVSAEQKREDCMTDFLRDPASNIKIFLSSYYRNQGLIWSEPRCRDGPLLLLFWLKYLLRNRVFDASVDGEDMINSLKDAVETANKAKRELPATHKIAQAIPCQFSKGCLELWGTRCKTWEDLEFATSTPAPVSAPWMNDDTPVKTSDPPAEAPETLANPWDDDNPAYKSDWEAGPRTSLLPILGLSVFPLTHEPGVVEWSTRRIVSVEPPSTSTAALEGLSAAELVEEELNRRLGKVVLAPWLGWDKHEKSDITKPIILPKSKGKVILPDGVVAGDDGSTGDAKPHNPVEDSIAVLVDPAVLEKLVIGMGLGATWIQIVPQGEDVAARRTIPGRYWYAEQLMHVLPSFHTEP